MHGQLSLASLSWTLILLARIFMALFNLTVSVMWIQFMRNSEGLWDTFVCWPEMFGKESYNVPSGLVLPGSPYTTQPIMVQLTYSQGSRVEVSQRVSSPEEQFLKPESARETEMNVMQPNAIRNGKLSVVQIFTSASLAGRIPCCWCLRRYLNQETLNAKFLAFAI